MWRASVLLYVILFIYVDCITGFAFVIALYCLYVSFSSLSRNCVFNLLVLRVCLMLVNLLCLMLY